MDEGRIVEDGDPEVLLNSPTTERLKDFLQHIDY